MNDELMQERFTLMRERISEIQKEELVGEPYRDFFRKTKNSSVKISFPLADIHQMFTEGVISQEDVKSFEKLFTREYFYVEEKEPSFATYIKKSDVRSPKPLQMSDNNIYLMILLLVIFL